MFGIFKKKNASSEQADKKREEKQRIAEANEKHIQSVMKKTGWNHEKAVAEIKAARKVLSIKYRDYDKYNFFNVPREQWEEEYKKILEDKERIEKKKEANIQSVMGKTGWTREETINNIEDVKNRYGIKYWEYDKYDFHKCPVEEQEQYYQDIVKKNKKKDKRKKNKKQRFIDAVVEKTGWEREDAIDKMNKAQELCGAEYKDYVAYKFWELDDETQKTYFTKGHANALRKKYNTKEENISCFMDKDKFNQVFSECLGRAWTYNIDVTLEEFKDKFANESKIIYKPLSASCGSGVTGFDINEENIEDVYNQLQELPKGVVEGYIIQHPEMSRYSKRSVNTIRLVTVRTEDEVHVLYAAFRMGGGDAIVDNFHSGGVLALIDVETGVVATNAIDLEANVYEKHPATGEIIKGFQIPFWKETVELISRAGKIVEGIGYVGWDIAITGKGPVLIEGNTAPAPNVLQLPYAIEGKGMFHRVEKYL